MSDKEAKKNVLEQDDGLPEDASSDFTKLEFSRRGFILKTGAAAVAGVAAYSVPSVAFAAPPQIMTPDPDNATGQDVAFSLARLTDDLTGVAGGITGPLSAALDAAASATTATAAQASVATATGIVAANFAALDAASGGAAWDADFIPTGGSAGIGGLFTSVLSFLTSLGDLIRKIICKIKKIACRVAASAAFGACTIAASATALAKCHAKCKWFLAIPFIGKAAYAVCFAICLGLTGTAGVLACYATYKASLVACGELCYQIQVLPGEQRLGYA